MLASCVYAQKHSLRKHPDKNVLEGLLRDFSKTGNVAYQEANYYMIPVISGYIMEKYFPIIEFIGPVQYQLNLMMKMYELYDLQYSLPYQNELK